MSGIEVAGIVLGVLPMIFKAMRGYSTVCNGLHTFRDWSKEVQRMSTRLKVYNGIFLNECRLLLRLIEDEKTVDNMFDNDCADGLWQDANRNAKLEKVLEDNYELCCDVMKATKEIVEDLETELEKFEVLQKQRTSGEKLTSTIKRLRQALSITFDKSKYEECLTELRDRNYDLNRLLAQMSALKQTRPKSLIAHKPLPSRFTSVQSTSQKLHEALCDAWCCDDLAHRGHWVKLCLDAKVEREVQLDIVISCQEANGHTVATTPTDPPIWLYVQSVLMAQNASLVAPPTSALITDIHASLPPELQSPPLKANKRKASPGLGQTSSQKSKVPKQVRFGIVNSRGTISSTETITSHTSLTEFNLMQTKSICYYFKQYQVCNMSPSKNCVGYLEKPQLYKHRFFAKDLAERNASHNSFHSVFDLMKQDADDFLGVEDQLKLAHRAAIAILQFNDTPWLSDRWRLEDLSCSASTQIFDETALKTLHLSSQISSPPHVAAARMEGVQCPTGVSDEVKYGINNLPLFFLGVALLDIAHWKPLESQMCPQDCDDQVYAARRLASGRAPLGPEYQKIAQKCLQCNFGFGTKLSSKRLQAAVYNDVIRELEGMMERLTT